MEEETINNLIKKVKDHVRKEHNGMWQKIKNLSDMELKNLVFPENQEENIEEDD